MTWVNGKEATAGVPIQVLEDAHTQFHKSAGNEEIPFPDDGILHLAADYSHLPGDLIIDGSQQTLRFSPPGNLDMKELANTLTVSLVPFPQLRNVYAGDCPSHVIGQEITRLLGDKRYDITRQFLGLTKDGDDTQVPCTIPFASQACLVIKYRNGAGVLRPDILRLNLGSKTGGVESVYVERLDRVAPGMFARLGPRLRRGNRIINIVSAEAGTAITPWANTLALEGFMTRDRMTNGGLMLPQSFATFEPQISIRPNDHHGILFRAQAGNKEGLGHIGAVFGYTWQPDANVVLNPPDLDEIRSLSADDFIARSRVVVQSMSGSYGAIQDLGIFYFMQHEGETYMYYKQGTDFGSWKGLQFTYSTTAPHIFTTETKATHQTTKAEPYPHLRALATLWHIDTAVQQTTHKQKNIIL